MGCASSSTADDSRKTNHCRCGESSSTGQRTNPHRVYTVEHTTTTVAATKAAAGDTTTTPSTHRAFEASQQQQQPCSPLLSIAALRASCECRPSKQAQRAKTTVRNWVKQSTVHAIDAAPIPDVPYDDASAADVSSSDDGGDDFAIHRHVEQQHALPPHVPACTSLFAAAAAAPVADQKKAVTAAAMVAHQHQMVLTGEADEDLW